MADSLPRIGVLGATGYAGAEIVRLLLAHPGFELSEICSRGAAGRPLSSVHPGLLGFTELRFEPLDVDRLAALDAVLLAVPHGAATELAAALDAAGCPRIIDLSSDHRHARGWVYGQAEWSHERLLGARRIAVPGCFATAISLAVAPFVAAGVLNGPVRCVAATGSTGAGATARATTHHPERFANLNAYKILRHQHGPEINTFLRGLGPFDGLRFVPLSAPLDRGILATCFLESETPAALRGVLDAAYAAHPLVRVRDESPQLRTVRGTGLCDLALFVEDDQAVVLSAIDNLGKGAAFQALQCLNLSFEVPVNLGVSSIPALP